VEYTKVSNGIFDPIKMNKAKFQEKFGDQLAELFPSAVKDGVVNFASLLAELGQYINSDERYELSWAGKADAKRLANTDIVGRTLKYIEKDSLLPDSTQNLYLEGDNLEILKVLRNSYYNSVKVIYIDPPYNTGNDFIYRDNYVINSEVSDKAEGDIDDDGKRLIVNQKSNGRFHSNWLSMMYSRLKVAYDLMSDDGIICVSISDVEASNLRIIMDDIFDEENFINTISIKSKVSAGASGGGEDKRLKKNIEYIHIYAKNIDNIEPLANLYQNVELMNLINEMREDGQSWKYTSVLVGYGDRRKLKTIEDGEGNPIDIYLRENVQRKTISQLVREEGLTEEEVYRKYLKEIFSDTNAQTSIRTRVIDAVGSLEEGTMYEVEYVPRSGKMKGKKVVHHYISNSVRRVIWLSDVAEEVNGVLYKKERLSTLWADIDYNNVGKEGDIAYANGKKPIELIKRCISINNDPDAIILDFFAGSASTAHAVMQLNIEDDGNRKFIMVQIPENLDESYARVSDPATKQGIKNAIELLDSIDKPHYLSELGKERIRRAGQKIKQEHHSKEGIEKLDVGFKVFGLANTNIRWFSEAIKSDILDYDMSMTDKDQLDFNPGFTDIDVVYEILLRHRDIPLTTNVEKLTNIGNRTYIFADTVVVCLEETITEEMINKIAAIEPMATKIIFRDSAFGDDISLKENTMIRLEAQMRKNSGQEKRAYRVEFI
jgi:adenine-specific DNA-methyltransferase